MKFISQCIAKWPDKQQQAARTRDEYDFLPAYLDIVECPAAPWAHRIAERPNNNHIICSEIRYRCHNGCLFSCFLLMPTCIQWD